MLGTLLNAQTLSLGIAGLVIVALGAWVFALRPSDPRHRAFSLYLFLYGAVDIFQALPFLAVGDRAAQYTVGRIALLATGWALVWFLLVFPRPRLAPQPARLLLAAIAAAFAALAGLILVAGDAGRRFLPDGTEGATPLHPVVGAAWVLPLAVAPFVFSLDLLRGAGSGDRGALRLVAVAGTLWPLYDLTRALWALARASGMDEPGSEWLLASRVARVAILLLVVAAAVNLLRQARREGSPVGGLLAAFALGPATYFAAQLWGIPGSIAVVELALPILVTLAILRGGLFGLDVKLRFAISKSSLAAVFIAVFFVASETAQQFFGERFESGYLGILAAGALVFAIAPLSRIADRLAERAVPAASPAPAAATGREARYREVLARYLADGRLTREEERTLAHLAADLGIDAGRAYELRAEVEAGREAP